jgi:hypothetical protein
MAGWYKVMDRVAEVDGWLTSGTSTKVTLQMQQCWFSTKARIVLQDVVGIAGSHTPQLRLSLRA